MKKLILVALLVAMAGCSGGIGMHAGVSDGGTRHSN
jgi:hypothetical protein